ncbi:CU044_2847 family protein [Kitasatospora sp. KL5]|uniref:CU044_2847 family protein n=1 Tax=Kitasatospora sp. KL5 TaxID=3425125 RepID=UPI003D6FDC37
MPQLVQLAMPDGQVIWASVEGPGGPRDTGLGDRIAEKVEGFQEALRAVAGNVRDAVEAVRPDEVCVEFGLELAAGKHGIVAAVAGVDGKATFKIALKWTHPPTAPAAPADPADTADAQLIPAPAGA